MSSVTDRKFIDDLRKQLVDGNSAIAVLQDVIDEQRGKLAARDREIERLRMALSEVKDMDDAPGLILGYITAVLEEPPQ